MLFDWFTIVAQIVNFLVLVALLKRFLWPRLIRAIDEREQGIAARLAEAGARNAEAQRYAEEMRTRALEQERQRAELLSAAQREAGDRRNEMIQQAREAVRRLEEKWHEDLEREQAAVLEEIRSRAGAEILAVVRRALADLAGVDVQRGAVEVLLAKLEALEGETVGDLTSGDVTVLTAAELPAETRTKIQALLEQRAGKRVAVQFVRTTGFAWGIELRGNGRRIGWNSTSYVDLLEENLAKAFEKRLEPAVR